MEGFQVLLQEWVALNTFYWDRACSHHRGNNFQATDTAVLTDDKGIVIVNP